MRRNPSRSSGLPRAQSRGKRILLIRSGRHLGIALDALRTRFPGCEVGVVGTPGSEAAVAQAGVAPADYFLYPAARVQPVAFRLSRTARAARRWSYDGVAILWNDPNGTGQGNVDRTAMIMSPAGYLAITPDGTVLERSSWALAARESLRAAASVSVGAALWGLLFVPARVALAVATAFRRTA